MNEGVRLCMKRTGFLALARPDALLFWVSCPKVSLKLIDQKYCTELSVTSPIRVSI